MDRVLFYFIIKWKTTNSNNAEAANSESMSAPRSISILALSANFLLKSVDSIEFSVFFWNNHNHNNNNYHNNNNQHHHDDDDDEDDERRKKTHTNKYDN